MNFPPTPIERRGVAAVVIRAERLLVIRRAAGVAAPGRLCFPGGGVEPGESEAEAVRREFREELGEEARPVRRLWTSVTAWRVELAWWTARLDPAAVLRPNPAEVAEVLWLTAGELAACDELLSSNRDFLHAWADGRFDLPGAAPCRRLGEPREESTNDGGESAHGRTGIRGATSSSGELTSDGD